MRYALILSPSDNKPLSEFAGGFEQKVPVGPARGSLLPVITRVVRGVRTALPWSRYGTKRRQLFANLNSFAIGAKSTKVKAGRDTAGWPPTDGP